jgi:hypothetical protein
VLGEVDIPSAQQSALAVRPPRRGQRRRTADFLGGVFAMLLLPLSIFPVLLLGPSVLRAPVTLGREAWGDVQRLERSLQPAHAAHRSRALSPARPSIVSLGPVYGRWTAFPQKGATRTGSLELGPEDQRCLAACQT